MNDRSILIFESRARARCRNDASSCEFLEINADADSCNSLLCSTSLHTSSPAFLSGNRLSPPSAAVESPILYRSIG
ncbi:hypothetical protein HanXRQr2_Chr16g0757261 [Helianthus annuus]|uniref:Uncharacterized protein n=1 Tax=Helianthus annuus TaxID=4232 RepID=A0A9K3GZE0_HELAN|nr:hypothetical protein HanXRQr2_Chr16g0757261 [Helianthus annuus]KAJ0821914.1 hypothetical protein HanPSC8_Chr16g0725771 [Helianthus annuus]